MTEDILPADDTAVEEFNRLTDKIGLIEAARILLERASHEECTQIARMAREKKKNVPVQKKQRGRPTDPQSTQARLLKSFADAASILQAASSGNEEVIRAARRAEAAYQTLKTRGYPVSELSEETRRAARRIITSHRRAKEKSSITLASPAPGK